MRFRRNLIGAAALAASLALVAGACGSDDDGGAADTTAAGAETTAAGADTTAAGGETTAAAGGDTTAAGGHGRVPARCTGTVEPIATAEADGAGKTVGLLFDVTGRGDKSFNDGAAAGHGQGGGGLRHHDRGVRADRADGSDRPERIAGFVGDDLIVAVGFLWGDATTASAAENPDQMYAIIDSVVNVPDSDPPTPAPNVRSMVFAEQEGSFLVGAAAACASPTGKLGFIGGVENDLIKKFEAGYIAGAQAVNPDATVEVQYITQPPDFTGFNDPAKGKAIAHGHVRQRHRRRSTPPPAARVTACSRPPWSPARRPARSTPSASTPTSTRRWRRSCSPTSSRRSSSGSTWRRTRPSPTCSTATLTGEVKVYNAANNGVGYAISNEAINQYAGTLEELKAQIIDGTITVPEVPGG